MARYGRDYGQDRWNLGGGYGGNWTGGRSARGGGEYGGMGSDANYGGGSQAYGGHSGFGSGGGSYDNDFGGAGYRGGMSGGGYGGYGYGGAGYTGGGYGGGGSYGASGGGGGYGEGGFMTGGTQSDWGGGRDMHRGGYGYGGGGGAGGYGGYGYGGGTGGSGGGTWGGGQQSSGGTQGDELRRMRAADVMTENPETVTPDTTLADAARKMRDLDVGIIPVVDGETSKRLRGVLTDRDITIRAVAEGKDAMQCKVSEVMTTEVETCNKNDTLRDVLGVMEREQVRRVPITDREGRLVGIIAQADVLTDVNSHSAEHHVTDTLESISQPSHRGGGRASQGRGGSTGNGWSAGSGGVGNG